MEKAAMRKECWLGTIAYEISDGLGQFTDKTEYYSLNGRILQRHVDGFTGAISQMEVSKEDCMGELSRAEEYIKHKRSDIRFGRWVVSRPENSKIQNIIGG